MTTIINPQFPLPFDVGGVIVETKALWNDEWEAHPDVEPVSIVRAAGQTMDQATLMRHYGETKYQWQTAFANTEPLSLRGRWVRIRFVSSETGGTPQTVFHGHVPSHTRRIRETGDPSGVSVRPPSGRQLWTALGGMDLLRRTLIDEAIWLDENRGQQRIEWVPDMNALDKHRNLIGNRTINEQSAPLGLPTHVFRGETAINTPAIWSHYDMLLYLIERFVKVDGGPNWVLGGELDALRNMETHIRFGSSQPMNQLLGELIPIERGLHFAVEPFESPDENDGFMIWVFALTAQERTFGGFTLPQNPDTVRIAAPMSEIEKSLTIAETNDELYDGIRVSGRRLVVCTTLSTELAALGDPSLVPAWTQAQEDRYIAGTGTPTDKAPDHDLARSNEIVREVYRSFRAPSDWNMGAHPAAPLLDNEGKIVLAAIAPYQLERRETLRWLPLLEGYDYTVDPPVNTRPGITPDLMPATVWGRTQWSLGFTKVLSFEYYAPVDGLGISVSVPQNDWGVFLSCAPNHLIGGTFDVTDPDTAPTEHIFPRIDWRYMHATIAFESDQRLVLEYGDMTSPYVKVIDVPDAEKWVLMNETVVGVDDSTGNVLRSPPNPVVLRDDSDRLAQVMAGAIARYFDMRVRGEWVSSALHPWSNLIGAILTIVEEEGHEYLVDAPITQIAWTWRDDGVETRVNTGFAGA